MRMTYMPMQDEQRRDTSIQKEHLVQLKKIETQLSTITGNKLKEEDTNED